MSARELFSLPQSLVRRQRRDHGRRLVLPALVGFVVAALAQSGRARSRASGTRSAARPGLPQRSPSADRGAKPTYRTAGGRDAADAARAERGIDRPRRDAGAALHDVPRRRGMSEADSPNLAGQYAGRDLQGAARFQVGRPHQRGHGAASSPNLTRPGHARSRGLLRLSAAAAGLSPDAAVAEAAHRRTARRCATSLPAAPATAASTTRPAAPGSRASPRPI